MGGRGRGKGGKEEATAGTGGKDDKMIFLFLLIIPEMATPPSAHQCVGCKILCPPPSLIYEREHPLYEVVSVSAENTCKHVCTPICYLRESRLFSKQLQFSVMSIY